MPYQEEKYVDVDANSTAYVIPMEAGTKDQTKLKSEAYYEQNKVSIKRIYTQTQWHSKGIMWYSGEWIPSTKVIIVNRTPVTREWNGVGGGSDKSNNQMIEVEII